jgi:hypothetical protein
VRYSQLLFLIIINKESEKNICYEIKLQKQNENGRRFEGDGKTQVYFDLMNSNAVLLTYNATHREFQDSSILIIIICQ